MAKATFSIPALWADHHVLAMRAALNRLDGVQEVVASSLYRDVVIQFDDAVVSVEALGQALSDAGYVPEVTPSLPTYPDRKDDSSDWFRFQERITETDLRDLQMSGDHRKY